MRLIRNRIFNASVVTMISLFYGVIYTVISGHIEFKRIIPKGKANLQLWEYWRRFLMTDNVKYIGIFTILLGWIILIRTVYVVIKYKQLQLDEYEVSIFHKGLGLSGLAAILTIPLLLLTILSEPAFSVLYLMFFTTFIWITFLFANLYFAFKN